MKKSSFLKDISGLGRASSARREAFRSASPIPVTRDPITEVAREWHPGRLELAVTEIRETSIHAKTFRFERLDGKKLPPFYAGQYMVIEFPVGTSIVTRPYSISSAPYEARLDTHPFVEITVCRPAEDGFAASFLHDEVQVGDTFPCLIGCGQFFYEPLRDSKNIVALADGSGITPFCSMAKEIKAGRLDIDLTILYASVFYDDILLREELEACECDRVRVIHVLSGSAPGWEGETGLLTAELIQAYSPEDASYFVCGPQRMKAYVQSELAFLQIPARRIRYELSGPVRDITQYPGFPLALKDRTFHVSVVRGVHEDVIEARATESLATALERASIRMETGCRSGECGFCRTKVLAGEVFIPPEADGRRAADREFGYVHACSAYPLSDLKIKIPIL